MPSIDAEAREWELELAAGIGAAVKLRRKHLGMTAAQLSERTRVLGHPISRVAITKIETNQRGGKAGVAEVLVLALALDVPPVALIVPSYPEGITRVAPRRAVSGRQAADWIRGDSPLPGSPENDGTELVSAVENLDRVLAAALEVVSAKSKTWG